MDLLKAIKDKNLSLTRELLAKAGKEEVSFEFYQDGTWGAHNRESAIHHALFNLRNTLYEEQHKDKNPEKAKEDAKNWREVVIELINKGAAVNASYEDYDWRGCGSAEKAFELILSWAMAKDDGEMLLLALQHGGDPNAANIRDVHSMRTDGRSVTYPIHTAVSQLSYGCTKALVEGGADVNAVRSERYNNERGYNQDTQETALHIAIRGSRYSREEEEVAEGEARNNQLRLLLLLLEAGADVHARRYELVQEHVEVESPTDDPRDDRFVSSVRCVPRKESPLLLAIRVGRPDIVRMLLAFGADPSVCKYEYGKEVQKTAEQMAADAGPEMVEALTGKWEPRHHSLFPSRVRRSVFTTLCVAKRQQWHLPPELVYVIIGWLVRPPFPLIKKATTSEEAENVARMSARNRIAIW